MKKLIQLSLIYLLIITPHFASAQCLLLKENELIIFQQGDCTSRHAPHCSFNIALSLMGFNEGLLIDETHPEPPFKEGYLDYIEQWEQPHNPQLWMKHSCVWYSRILSNELGMGKFKAYIKQFGYGNQRVATENLLSRSAIQGGLAISPEEQIRFLQCFLDRKLDVSEKSYDMTKKIIFVQDLPDGWKLYGKTGSGSQLNPDGTLNEQHDEGWFVGWVEKNERKIVFASFVEKAKTNVSAGREAKAILIDKLRLDVTTSFDTEIKQVKCPDETVIIQDRQA